MKVKEKNFQQFPSFLFEESTIKLNPMSVWVCLCFEVYLLVHTYFFCTRVGGNPLVMDPNSICRRTRTLEGRHADMCQSQPEIIQEVAKGARLGMRECQHQFHNRRWNCSSQSRNLAKILQQGEEQYKSSSWFLLIQLKPSGFSMRLKWMQSAF